MMARLTFHRYGQAMSLFLTTLHAGGPAYMVGEINNGFLIHLVDGRDSGFNEIARLVIDKAGPTYSAFPRSDGRGGYDCVIIIPHD
jgi:hypothetical protein